MKKWLRIIGVSFLVTVLTIVLLGVSIWLLSPKGATFSRIKTWTTGETLTAAQLNAEFDNFLDNLDPTGIDDESASDAAAQATSDPYSGSSLTRATSLEVEIQQLRYLIAQITGETYWYIDPDIALDTLATHITTITANNWVTTARITDANVTTAKIKDANVTEAKIGTGAVTNAKLGADAVDDTKIGDAKIKKEHINADVVGTGLAGGAGTALSVDGIVEQGSGGDELKVKVIEIGDWNMDSTAIKNVAHGLTMGNIRSVSVLIIRDDDSFWTELGRDYSVSSDFQDSGYFNVTAANIALYRVSNAIFDNANFDSTSFNRGYVTIWYTA